MFDGPPLLTLPASPPPPPGKVDRIVLRAISDWGFGKSDAARERAARNAADSVVHTIRSRALDHAPFGFGR